MQNGVMTVLVIDLLCILLVLLVLAARVIIWNRVFVVFRTEKGESLCNTFLTEIVESGTKNYCLIEVIHFYKSFRKVIFRTFLKVWNK